MTVKQVIKNVRKVLQNGLGIDVIYDPPTEEPTTGRFRPATDLDLHSDVLAFCEKNYPRGLFRHQHKAIRTVLAGVNTVVTTRTSSGKSLIYSLPVFDAMCRAPETTALFLYPQKALANDQFIKLQKMARNIERVSGLCSSNSVLVARYDGSVPSELRPEIREGAQIILTNPDMLHLGILQHHDRHWTRFFKRLRYVAVDECHEYRGVFGTNVAWVLRRLRQICNWHGSDPCFIATSATVKDPQLHMEHLVGAKFVSVGPDSDGSSQGRRKVWMVTGTDHYYETGRRLAFELAEHGLTVLAFCPSRKAAERMTSWLSKSDSEQHPYVRVYRSGLSSQERDEIEHGLRSGTVRLVFSTSALELGIDIGAIDAVICIGLPSTMMSLWQRAGRAARNGKEGATVFIPADTPIDSYFARHPEEFYGRSHEPLVLNLANERILCQHYACAVQEVGGDEDRLGLELLGTEMTQVHRLRSEGKLNREEFYRSDPHAEVNIRSTGEGTYSLMLGDARVGEIDSFHLLREAYRNAIYLHGGRPFRVKDVIRGRRQVQLQAEYTKHETVPYIRTRIRLKRQVSTSDYSGIRIATAALDVTETLIAVTEKDRSGKAVRVWQGASGMSPHQLPTEGVMLLIKPPLWDSLCDELGAAAQRALQACERLLWGLFPTVVGPCDLQDYSSGVDQLPTGEHAVFLYDQVYDGAGLTKSAFHKLGDLIEKSLERLVSCDCQTDAGCIRCIANPRVNEEASKRATSQVLAALQEMIAHETPRVVHADVDWETKLASRENSCRQCSSTVPIGARFCPNCGEPQETKS